MHSLCRAIGASVIAAHRELLGRARSTPYATSMNSGWAAIQGQRPADGRAGHFHGMATRPSECLQFPVTPSSRCYRKMELASDAPMRPLGIIVSMPSSSMAWTCRTCGATHTGTPDSFSYEAPWPWYSIPEPQRAARGFLTEDYCAIEDEDFFVRGCLEVPILGRDSPLLWGVWVSLSRENFFRERSLAEDPRMTAEPPYFGWLSS
jgi:hypothetical protein